MTIFAARVGGAGYYTPIVGELTSTIGTTDGNISWDADQPIGSADASRVVIVAATWTTNALRSYVARLDGGNMTLLVGDRVQGSNGQYVYAAIWALGKTTGTTANVEVQLSGTSGASNGISWAVYRVLGVDLGETVGDVNDGETSPITATIAQRQGDFLIGCGVANHTTTDKSNVVGLTRAHRNTENDSQHIGVYGNAALSGMVGYDMTWPGTITGGGIFALAGLRAA